MQDREDFCLTSTPLESICFGPRRASRFVQLPTSVNVFEATAVRQFFITRVGLRPYTPSACEKALVRHQ